MANEEQDFKYIDPMIDYGFKKIFKESGKKDLLIRPLNAIFGLEISDLEIGETEQLGETPDDRNASFDLYCTASDGSKFIVEVQLARQEHFLQRALYYTAFPITRSARKGRRRGGRAWDFDYPPVFFLGLLNFSFRDLRGQSNANPEHFVHCYSLRNDRTGERMTDLLQFAFLEIGRFDKRMEECVGFEDRFLYMMKNMPKFAETPSLWDDPYFTSLLDEAEYARMTHREKEQYREAMRRDWDYWNTIDYARKEGKAEEQRRIACRLLAAGLSVEQVAESTDLPVDQVLALQGD